LLLLTLAVVAAIGGTAYWVSGRGFSATEDPSKVEEMLARRVRQVAIPADAKEKKKPLADNAESFAGGKAHWMDHCATCHAVDGSGDTVLGRNMYPKAPDMRRPETQNLSKH
jgi:cytochrome c553